MKLIRRTAKSYAFVLVTAFVVFGGCAGQDNNGRSSDAPDARDSATVTGRIALVSVESGDSADVATPAIVDAMLAQVFDSIDGATWVKLEASGLANIERAEEISAAAEANNIDRLVALRIARLGSVVGVDLRLLAPDGTPVYHNRAFSFIRFREKEGTKLFGPALYEVLFRHALRLNGAIVGALPDGRVVVADAPPLLVGAVIIPRDTLLGRILDSRETVSTQGVKAIGDFLRFKFPEFIVFDYESRTRLYELLGLALVEDHAPIGDIERQAMYNVDVPYYIVAEIAPVGSDSVAIGVEVRGVTSVRSDTIVATGGSTYPLALFETSNMERDVISEILVVSEEVVRRARARLSSAR